MTYQEYLKKIAEQLIENTNQASSNYFICNAVVSYHDNNRDSHPLYEEHENKLLPEISNMISFLSAHFFYGYATLAGLPRYYAEIDSSETMLTPLQARLRFLKELAEKA